jgi:hypothetical protein
MVTAVNAVRNAAIKNRSMLQTCLAAYGNCEVDVFDNLLDAAS